MAIRRRLVSITAAVAVTLLVTLSLPILVPLAALATLVPAFRGSLPTLGFVTGILWCEMIGLLRFAWIGLVYRPPRDLAFEEAVFTVQRWWVSALRDMAQFFFRLTFVEHNTKALEGPAALFLPRHASIADVILPIAFYGIPQQLKLRYVLKRELLWVPCLDIGGNWIPNYFVDRSGANSEAAVAGVSHMTADLAADEGMMIFLEGTRFTRQKQKALMDKAGPGSELAKQIQRWPSLLPPRLGGGKALLGANREHDIVFCAHKGFENSSTFRSLLNGSWWRSEINIGYWRIPFSQIPKDPQDHAEFLFTQWDTMQDTIASFP